MEATPTTAPASGGPHGIPKQRKLLAVFAIVFVVLLAVVGLIALLIGGVSVHGVQQLPSSATPTATGAVTQQAALLYNNASSVVPILRLNYTTRNTTLLDIDLSYLASQPPTTVYMLNTSNECYKCSPQSAFMASLVQNLTTYGMLNGSSGVQVVSAGQLTSIRSGSVLVIPNGLMPSYMLNTSQGSSLLQQLLEEGVTVVYIGGDFAKLVTPQGVVIPDSNKPSYLSTTPVSSTGSSNFYFNQPLYAFTNGVAYGPLSYEHVFSGAIVAFPNYPNTWTAAEAGYDVAKSVYLAFWIPRVAESYQAVAVANAIYSQGSVGIATNLSSSITLNAGINQLNHAYGRISLTALNTAGKNLYYSNVYFTPSYSINDTLAMPSSVVPGQPFNTTIIMNVRNAAPFEPHIDIYTTNFTYMTSIPPLLSRQLSPPSFTFLKTLTFYLPSGSYIAELNGFGGQNYGSAYFQVPQFGIRLQSSNASASSFLFSITAAGAGVSNMTATVALGGQYPQNDAISNGYLTYNLPQGVSIPTGKLNFSFTIMSQKYYFSTKVAPPPSISINPQYIEFIIAIMIVIIEVTLIKAPARDEFYIDVPNLPSPPKMQIKVRYQELLSVFDKLNISYHWRYMPLSKPEFRAAVANNIRVGNISVMMTYNNLDAILDSLVSENYLVTTDGLYAPVSWIEQSKHDIDYLATFKKLRVYLVSHGHIFTDMDKSDLADIVTTLHNEKAYIVIYSKTSGFAKDIPIQSGIKTYLAFMNEDKLEEFKNSLYLSSSREAETLKMYISVGSLTLIDADNPEGILT